jgi:hypothetical protein
MTIDFEKGAGLVPAIIQDDATNKVLMLGYMNEESLEKTQKDGKVTFYSRANRNYGQKVKLPVISAGERNYEGLRPRHFVDKSKSGWTYMPYRQRHLLQ